jgi:hypothetical protein
MQSRRKTHETRQAAVSAFPQPRPQCPNCFKENFLLLYSPAHETISLACEACGVKVRSWEQLDKGILKEILQLFAPAPAQKPPKESISQRDWLECIDLADIHNTTGSSGYQPDDMIRRLEQIHKLLILAKPISGGASTGEQPQCYRDDGCPNPAMCESRGRMCTPTQDHPVLHSEPSAPKVEPQFTCESCVSPDVCAAKMNCEKAGRPLPEQAETASAPQPKQYSVLKGHRNINPVIDDEPMNRTHPIQRAPSVAGPQPTPEAKEAIAAEMEWLKDSWRKRTSITLAEAEFALKNVAEKLSGAFQGTPQVEAVVREWECMEVLIGRVLRGLPVRDLDEAMMRMETAVNSLKSYLVGAPTSKS